MTTTTHRAHLVLWAVVSALVGVMSMIFARGTSVCLVAPETSMADQAPWAWWSFALLAAFSFGLSLLMLALVRIRSDRAPCPHCGKEVEPRVTLMGELKMVAPP